MNPMAWAGHAKYEGRGHKFLEYRALRYNFQACYSGPLKPSWRGNSHFRDWLPIVIGLFSEWRADVIVSFRRLDHYMPCIPGTFGRVLRIARAVAFIWLRPYRGKMIRAGASSSNNYLIS
jgi:hypothetical protein